MTSAPVLGQVSVVRTPGLLLGDSWIQNLDLGDSGPHQALSVVPGEAVLEEALKDVTEAAWAFEPTRHTIPVLSALSQW